MNDFLIGGWAEIKRLWSVWIGVIGTVLLAAIPVVADQWPNFSPTLVALFPKNGAQWVPVAGGIIAIIARIVSQSAIIDLIKKLAGKDST